jgi:hypothetical protein
MFAFLYNLIFVIPLSLLAISSLYFASLIYISTMHVMVVTKLIIGGKVKTKVTYMRVYVFFPSTHVQIANKLFSYLNFHDYIIVNTWGRACKGLTVNTSHVTYTKHC